MLKIIIEIIQLLAKSGGKLKSVPKKAPKTFPKQKPGPTQTCPKGKCAPTPKTMSPATKGKIDDIVKDARPGKASSSRQFEKDGGLDKANKDFDELTKGSPVQDRPGGVRTSELPDGTKVNVRPSSSGPDPKPTLEIQPTPGNGKPIKIRYP
jgi:hypothetical protein